MAGGDMLLKAPLIYEPKKQNRFIFRFPSDLGIQEWTVESAKRPSIKQAKTDIKFLNTQTSVLGSYSWEDIKVTLRDMIGPSTAQAVMEWIRLHSESLTGRQGYAAGYKRDLELEILDPTGAVIEKWIIKNAWVTDADFGDVKYGTDDLLNITLTIVYDYAILAY